MSYKVDDKRTNSWLRNHISNQTDSRNRMQTTQHNRKSMPPSRRLAHAETTPQRRPRALRRTTLAISIRPHQRTPTPLRGQPEKN